MKVTKKNLISFIKSQLTTDPKWAVNALKLLYSKQHPTEQINQSTFITNEAGFNAYDAPILSKFYTKLKTEGLSKYDLHLLHKIIKKYSNQILKFGDKQKILLGYEQFQKKQPGTQTDLNL